jgi:cell division protein FtsZ
VSPLLDDLSINGAQGILINITGPDSDGLGLEEVATISDFVTASAHPEAEVFVGQAFDESLAEDGAIKVTVIATGLGHLAARPVASAVPAEETRDLVEPGPAEEPKVLPFAPPADPAVAREPERIPAHDRAAASSAIRRERLKRAESMGYGEGNLERPAIDRVQRKPHDSLNLGEDNYAVPAYLRKSAD